MKLILNIYQSDNEYIVETPDGVVGKFRDLDLLIRYVTQHLINTYRNNHAIDSSMLERHSWYIRIPPDRLLEILKYAVDLGVDDVNELLVKYLNDKGLNKSNIRVILPTLKALGLTQNGHLSAEAKEIGKLLKENRIEEVLDLLFTLIMKNKVLRQIVDTIVINDHFNIENTVKSVMESYGMTRRDEINYTCRLINMILSSRNFICMKMCKDVEKYLGNFKSHLKIDTIHEKCKPSIMKLIMNYLLSSSDKKHQIQNILEIPIDNLELKSDDERLMLKYRGFDKIFAFINYELLIVDNDYYAPSVRVLIEKLRNLCKFKTCLNMVLIIIKRENLCKLKLYMEYICSGKFNSKIIDLP